jgi:hypothetical protein
VGTLIRISTGGATEKQIDQLQNLVNAIILASIVIILADASDEKNVSFFGLKMDISGAYGIAASAFILGTLMMVQLFARLAEIVMSADAEEAPEILAKLFNHQWSFNPFSYFGSRPVAALHASFGAGLLIFVWWLELTALAQLWGRMTLTGAWERELWYAYIVTGFLALISILNVHWSVGAKLAELARSSDDADLKNVAQAVKHVLAIRCSVAMLFTALGYWLYYSFTHIGM